MQPTQNRTSAAEIWSQSHNFKKAGDKDTGYVQVFEQIGASANLVLCEGAAWYQTTIFSSISYS